MTVQLVTRVPDALAQTVDRLVASGIFIALRRGPCRPREAVVDLERPEALGRAIVDGYRRLPQEETTWGGRIAQPRR